MPTLDNIAKTLSAPETGLVHRVGDLETFGVKVHNSVFAKKTGLVSRMDRMENAINNGPTSLSQKVKNLETNCAKIDPIDVRLKEVEGKVMQTDGGTTPSTPLTSVNSNVQEEVRANKRKCAELSDKVSMSSNYLEVLAKDVAVLKKQVLVNTAKRLVNELVIGGIRVEEAEDPVDTTKRFLMNKLNLMFNSDDLLEATRSNNVTEKRINNRMVRIPPVMFIKVTDKLRKQILSNTWRLANLKDDIDGFGYYVKQSMPEEYRAVRARHQTEFNKIKDENWDIPEGEPRSDCWFVEDRFYVDGKIQKEQVLPPTPADMLFMSADTRQQLDGLDVKVSIPREEQRSRFTGYCAKVRSLHEIQLVYMKVKMLEQRADHIMMAYRLKDADILKEGSVSNGEHFGDLELLKVLQFQERVNAAVFVARVYGGVHLGRLRFRIIKEVAEEALTQQPGEFFCMPKPQRQDNRRGRGRNRGRGTGRGENNSRGGYRGRFFRGGGRGFTDYK